MLRVDRPIEHQIDSPSNVDTHLDAARQMAPKIHLPIPKSSQSLVWLPYVTLLNLTMDELPFLFGFYVEQVISHTLACFLAVPSFLSRFRNCVEEIFKVWFFDFYL